MLHCHGNGLVISGVYSGYTQHYLIGSRIYARKVNWPPDPWTMGYIRVIPHRLGLPP